MASTSSETRFPSSSYFWDSKCFASSRAFSPSSRRRAWSPVSPSLSPIRFFNEISLSSSSLPIAAFAAVCSSIRFLADSTVRLDSRCFFSAASAACFAWCALMETTRALSPSPTTISPFSRSTLLSAASASFPVSLISFSVSASSALRPPFPVHPSSFIWSFLAEYIPTASDVKWAAGRNGTANAFKALAVRNPATFIAVSSAPPHSSNPSFFHNGPCAPGLRNEPPTRLPNPAIGASPVAPPLASDVALSKASLFKA